MAAVAVPSPAKLNLRLKVVGRRDDGYHLLSMLNVPVGLSDSLSLAVTDAAGLRLVVRGGPPELQDPALNLAARAAAWYWRWGGNGGLELCLEKSIPTGGGLGGGSSNAAAVLTAIPALLGGAPGPLGAELQAAALQLGADVPYFLAPKAAWVQGIGERMQALPEDFFTGIEVLLVMSDFGVPTPAVYERLRQSAAPEGGEDFEMRYFTEQLEADSANYQRLIELIENDLLAATLSVRPQLSGLYESLKCLSQAVVGLSGSGSTFFILARQSSIIGPDLEAAAAEVAGFYGARVWRTSISEPAVR